MKEKILIDTDIGDDIDDAYALIYALNRADLDLVGVVTTYRNSAMRTKIAQSLIEEYGASVPVWAGEDDPEKEPYHNFKHEKFENGKPIISHYDERMEKYPVATDGVDIIAQKLREYGGELNLVAIGPLTDIARLIERHADAVPLIKTLYVMGGDFKNERAEWNIRCDPEAAAKVFSSGIPMKVFGWEITTQTVFDRDTYVAVRAMEKRHSSLIKMTDIWLRDNAYRNLPIMHDPLAVASITETFCTFERMRVSVVLEGKRRGITDFVDDPNGSIEVATSIDVDRFFRCILATLENKNL